MLPQKGVASAVVCDVWIAQLDRKRVPQARSSGCKSSVAVTEANVVFEFSVIIICYILSREGVVRVEQQTLLSYLLTSEASRGG